MASRSIHQKIFVGALVAPIAVGILLSLWRQTFAYVGLATIFSGVVTANLPRWARADLVKAGRKVDARNFTDARRLAQRFLGHTRRWPWLIAVSGVELAPSAPAADVIALNVLTAAHLGLGDLSAARDSAEAALALAPESADACHMMGQFKQHTDRGAAARPWFEKADALGYPYTADDQEGLGRSAVLESLEERTVDRADAPPIEAGLMLDGPFLVRMLNDDKTPMEFVVVTLEDIFDMSHITAVRSMLKIHREGGADCGAYDRQTADAKAAAVISRAREASHPLQCIVVANPAA